MFNGAKRRWLCAAFFALAGSAEAHLMPTQKGTVNIKENAAFVVVALPLSTFDAVDDDHDGKVSAAEMQNHRTELENQVQTKLRFFDGDKAGSVEFIQINTEEDEAPTANNAQHYLVLMKIGFDQAPQQLRLENALFSNNAGEQNLSLRATRGTEVEVIHLTATHTQHVFFQNAGGVFEDYLKLGVEHILSGTDHLLFLLTIVIAATGWRYWLGVLTSFTIAHSITLTLGLAGVIRISPAIVEPLIAASIIGMALLNLKTHHPAMRTRFIIVFACGLLHGLGFASAMGEMGLHGNYRLISLVSFNLGIELGQMIFLAGLLVLLFSLKKGLPLLRQPHKTAVTVAGKTMSIDGMLLKFVSLTTIVIGGLYLLHGLA